MYWRRRSTPWFGSTIRRPAPVSRHGILCVETVRYLDSVCRDRDLRADPGAHSADAKPARARQLVDFRRRARLSGNCVEPFCDDAPDAGTAYPELRSVSLLLAELAGNRNVSRRGGIRGSGLFVLIPLPESVSAGAGVEAAGAGAGRGAGVRGEVLTCSRGIMVFIGARAASSSWALFMGW